MTTNDLILARAGTVLKYVILVTGAVLMVFPFAWMVDASFMTSSEIQRRPPVWFPAEPQFQNYPALLEALPFGRLYLNSFIVTASTVVGVLFTSSLAGFAFAKYQFRLKKIGFLLVLLSLMLPFQVLLTPLFIEMARLKWLNTYTGIIVPFAASPFFIFLMRQYMLTVPDELLDAARIDGCSEFGLFWRVVAPIQKPAFGILGILAFNSAWNDYLWPLIVLQDKMLYTVNLGIAVLYGPYDTPFGTILAGSFLNTLPIVLVFLLLQRYFVAGLTAGALKGVA